MNHDEEQEPGPDAPAPVTPSEPAPPPAPRIADDSIRHPAPAHVDLVRLTWWIATMGISTGLGLGAAIVLLTVHVLVWPRFLAAAIWLAVSGGLTLMSLRWPDLEYRCTSYRVSGDRVEYRHGVVWRTVTSVPRSRVQHTDVQQGPLERRFEIARLVMHTAGTEHATVTLRGLEPEIARQIRDHLLPGSDDDAV